jgi:hypothetical protein
LSKPLTADASQTSLLRDSSLTRANSPISRAVMEIVENQLRDKDPAEVRHTLDRLITEGGSGTYARRLIGIVLLMEMNEMIAQHRAFDEVAYGTALRRLPNLS